MQKNIHLLLNWISFISNRIDWLIHPSRTAIFLSCGDFAFEFVGLLPNLRRLQTQALFWVTSSSAVQTQTRLQNGLCAQRRLRPVWSETLLSAWWKLGSLATHWAHSEDSDQPKHPWRLWSDWADLSLRWVDRSFCLFFFILRLISPGEVESKERSWNFRRLHERRFTEYICKGKQTTQKMFT